MKKPNIIIPLVLLMLLSSFSFSQTVSKDYIDGQIYFAISHQQYQSIIHKESKSKKQIINNLDDFDFLNDIFRKYGVKNISQPFNNATEEHILRILRLEFTEISDVELLISELSKIKDLYNVEKVPLYHSFTTPNDPLYNQNFNANCGVQWYLDIINASGAWDIAYGNSDGAVGIVDGAILETHPELSNVIVLAYDGETQTTGSSSPPANTYDWSHGTHCAGLIGAETNNNEGIASIGSGVSIYSAKSGRNSDEELVFVAEALNWQSTQPINVLSLSFGGPGSSTNEQDWYNYMYNTKDIVILAAAGNENTQEISYPAGYNNVIAVASSDSDDGRSSFSNYGTWVDIAAPGGFCDGNISMFSTTASTYDWGTGDGQIPYDVMQGTSMACPLAAGLVGLMRSYAPTLSASEIRTCLYNTCVGVGSYVQQGRIDAAAAMQCLPSSSNFSANFNADNTNIFEGESVNFTDISNDGGTAITSWIWSFPNGEPSTFSGQNPPSITYNTAGDYNVTLTVNNGTSDTETKNAYIHVAPPSTSYCTSSGSTEFATSITLVNLNTINNATGQTNGYEDYTSISTDLEIGSSYDLIVNANTDGNYQLFGKVWIDWNHDFDFDDDGEEFDMGNAANVSDGPTANSPLNITVPSEATVGNTRMRVSVKYEDPNTTEGSATACEENYDGEVEDYSINITINDVSVSSVNSNLYHIYPNPNKGQFKISLFNETNAMIKIYDLNGKIIFEEKQSSSNKNYNIPNLKSGIYIVKIITNKTIATKKITIE